MIFSEELTLKNLTIYHYLKHYKSTITVTSISHSGLGQGLVVVAKETLVILKSKITTNLSLSINAPYTLFNYYLVISL